jgi:hypothetical protein
MLWQIARPLTLHTQYTWTPCLICLTLFSISHLVLYFAPCSIISVLPLHFVSYCCEIRSSTKSSKPCPPRSSRSSTRSSTRPRVPRARQGNGADRADLPGLTGRLGRPRQVHTADWASKADRTDKADRTGPTRPTSQGVSLIAHQKSLPHTRTPTYSHACKSHTTAPVVIFNAPNFQCICRNPTFQRT